jgi:hypothetical protein
VEEANLEPSDLQAPLGFTTGLGGASYTQQQVDELSGTKGFMYIDWLGMYVPLPFITAAVP